VADQLRIPPMSDRALPPILVLVSDGQPTDDYARAITELLDLPWGKRAVRIAVAIGEDADHDALRVFVANPEMPVLQANSAETLVNYIKWASTAVLKAASAPASRQASMVTAGNVPTPAPPAASSAADVW
jgi:uncharacterized protein YegL